MIEKLQVALAAEPEFPVRLLTDRSSLRAAADLIRQAEQTRYEHEGIYQELYDWLRFTQGQAEAHRDGAGAVHPAGGATAAGADGAGGAARRFWTPDDASRPSAV